MLLRRTANKLLQQKVRGTYRPEENPNTALIAKNSSSKYGS